MAECVEPVPIEESVTVRSKRAAMRAARMWIKKTLADGPRPEADVARRLAELGLRHLLHAAAERLGVRCRSGQWSLPA